MRSPVLLLLLVCLLGLGAWLLVVRGDDGAPPPVSNTGPERPQQPVAPPEQGSGRVQVPTPPPTTTPSPDQPTPPTAATEPPNLVLMVRSLASRELVPAFRWQFRNSRSTERGEGAAGRAELRLEASAVGQLLVEADGHAPLVREGVIVPTPPAPAATVDLFLAPATPAEGIVLHVRDVALRPIANVRVDAFPLVEPPTSTDWQYGQSLWARRAAAADGRYPVPGLQPGIYGLRVLGVDENGAPLPLLPWLQTFTLTGSNGFVEDVALEPGALLTLDLVDHTGQPFDPTRQGTTSFDLRLVGGPMQKRKWVVRSDNSEASAIDVMPGIGKVQLADAVIGGPYQLDVLVNGTVRVARHQMFLRPGMNATERLVVP